MVKYCSVVCFFVYTEAEYFFCLYSCILFHNRFLSLFIFFLIALYKLFTYYSSYPLILYWGPWFPHCHDLSPWSSKVAQENKICHNTEISAQGLPSYELCRTHTSPALTTGVFIHPSSSALWVGLFLLATC